MSDEPREALAEIVYRVNNPRHGDYDGHEATADAILAAGWRPPVCDCQPFDFCEKCYGPEQQREAAVRQLAYCEASVQASADPEDGEQCPEPREPGSVHCARHQPSPLPDSETDWQWGIRVHDGSIMPLIHGDTEARARGMQASSKRGAVVVRREVGPWIEVTS